MRCELEDVEMQVEIDYYAPTTVELPSGPLESPANLTISLRWPDEPNPQGVVYVAIGRDVEAALSDETGRLLNLDGLVGDWSNWKLAPDVIGPHLWERVSEIAANGNDGATTFDIDAPAFEELQPGWRHLLEAARSGVVVSLRGSHERGTETEVMQSLWESDEARQAMLRSVEKILRPPKSP